MIGLSKFNLYKKERNINKYFIGKEGDEKIMEGLEISSIET